MQQEQQLELVMLLLAWKHEMVYQHLTQLHQSSLYLQAPILQYQQVLERQKDKHQHWQ
jgi:hypothetical protein